MTRLPDEIVVLERGWLSSNNVLLLDPDTATLIDSGYVAHAPQTVALVRAQLGGRSLARLINTHCHSDHMGGNAAIRRAFGAAIIIPSGYAPTIEAWDEVGLQLAGSGQRAERFGFDAVADAGDRFQLAGLEWEALSAPGHDRHALIFHCAERRILISGDALWANGFGAMFDSVLGVGDALAETRKTLDRIALLAVDIVIPGHGAPFTDFAAALERAYKRIEAFEEDPVRMGKNALRACFTFAMIEHQSMARKSLPDYLAATDLYRTLNERYFRLPYDVLAQQLVADLVRAGVLEQDDDRVRVRPSSAPARGAVFAGNA